MCGRKPLGSARSKNGHRTLDMAMDEAECLSVLGKKRVRSGHRIQMGRKARWLVNLRIFAEIPRYVLVVVRAATCQVGLCWKACFVSFRFVRW